MGFYPVRVWLPVGLILAHRHPAQSINRVD
jgi:hypothetical protein